MSAPNLFATRLRALRAAAGLSQTTLAHRAGLARATVRALEGNRRPKGPCWRTVLALADGLQVAVEAFRAA